MHRCDRPGKPAQGLRGTYVKLHTSLVSLVLFVNGLIHLSYHFVDV